MKFKMGKKIEMNAFRPGGTLKTTWIKVAPFVKVAKHKLESSVRILLHNNGGMKMPMEIGKYTRVNAHAGFPLHLVKVYEPTSIVMQPCMASPKIYDVFRLLKIKEGIPAHGKMRELDCDFNFWGGFNSIIVVNMGGLLGLMLIQYEEEERDLYKNTFKMYLAGRCFKMLKQKQEMDSKKIIVNNKIIK